MELISLHMQNYVLIRMQLAYKLDSLNLVFLAYIYLIGGEFYVL